MDKKRKELIDKLLKIGEEAEQGHVSYKKATDLVDIELTKALTLSAVSQQRELLIAVFERLDRTLLTMIEVGDCEKAVDEILGY